MKPILLTSAVLAFSLFSHAGVTADLATPAAVPVSLAASSPASGPADQTQLASLSQDLRLGSQGPRPAPVQLAAIGDNRIGSSPLVDGRIQAQNANSGGLPSTPVALSALLLMLCILIRRRNA